MRKLITALTLSCALLIGGAVGAEAHQQPYDSGVQTEHNLCVVFRPYGVGAVFGHYRITGTHRQCLVCIGGDPYAYEIQYWQGAGWTGPWDTTELGGSC